MTHWFVPSDEVGPVPSPEEQALIEQGFAELRERMATTPPEVLDAAREELERRMDIAMEMYRRGELDL